MAEETVQDRIRDRLRVLKLSPQAASLKAGLSRDYLRKLFKNPDQAPTGKSLTALAEALGVSEVVLFAGHGAAAPAANPNRIVGDVRPADVELPDRMPKNLPVLGTAAGSHLRGAFQLDPGAVIDMVRRPPALMNVPNAYALYVEGDSMYPEHNNGDLRFIHPGRPIRAGDSVIVQMLVNPVDGIEATIGRFVKKTDKGVTLEKLNPHASILLEARFITSVHKVLTLNELFGV